MSSELSMCSEGGPNGLLKLEARMSGVSAVGRFDRRPDSGGMNDPRHGKCTTYNMRGRGGRGWKVRGGHERGEGIEGSWAEAEVRNEISIFE